MPAFCHRYVSHTRDGFVFWWVAGMGYDACILPQVLFAREGGFGVLVARACGLPWAWWVGVGVGVRVGVGVVGGRPFC